MQAETIEKCAEILDARVEHFHGKNWNLVDPGRRY